MAGRDDWIKHRLTHVCVDFHIPEWPPDVISNMNLDDFFKTLEDANVEAVFFCAKDSYGNCTFSTKIGHKHIALKDRDLLREAVAKAHEHDIKVEAYYSVVWDDFAAKNNPDWNLRDPQGNMLRSDRNIWGHLCINSPYRNFVLEHLRELVANYEIDCIFLDMIIYHWTSPSCYCNYCEKKFVNELGYEIPKEPDWSNEKWRKYIKWRYRCIEQFIEEARNLVKSIRADCAFVHNYHGYYSFNWRVGQTAEGGTRYTDYCTGEAYPAVFGYNSPSELARFLRGVGGGKPCVTVVQRHTGLWDFSVTAENEIKWEVATILANGSAVSVVDVTYPDGRLEKEVYKRLGDVFAEAQKRKEYLLNAEPLKYVALYYSQNTKDFYARDELGKYIPFFDGAYKALVEAHIPVEIVSDRHLADDKGLEDFKVLILPNSVCLSHDQCESIRRFVRSGKGLVATYLTSMANENGEFRDNFSLNDLLGCNFIRFSEYSNSFVLPLDDPLTEGVPKIPHLHKGPLIRVKNGGGRTIAKIVDSIGELTEGRTYSFFPAVPDRVTDYPAIVANDWGNSRSVYMAGAYEFNYIRFAYGAYRKLLINSVIWSAKEDPLITVEAPMTVEATFFKQNGRYIVHLVNFHLQRPALSPMTTAFSQTQNPPVQIIEEIIPVHDIKLKIRTRIQSIYCIAQG